MDLEEIEEIFGKKLIDIPAMFEVAKLGSY